MSTKDYEEFWDEYDACEKWIKENPCQFDGIAEKRRRMQEIRKILDREEEVISY